MFEECFREVGRRYIFEYVGYERFAEIGIRTFVAEYETERSDIAHYFVSVVQARVGARAENAGQPRLTYEQSAGGSEQVAAHCDRGFELGHERRFHHFVLICAAAPRAVEMHVVPTAPEETVGKFEAYAV